MKLETIREDLEKLKAKKKELSAQIKLKLKNQQNLTE